MGSSTFVGRYRENINNATFFNEVEKRYGNLHYSNCRFNKNWVGNMCDYVI